MRPALCLLLAGTIVALAGCGPPPQESSPATPPAPTAVMAPTAGPDDTPVPTAVPSPAPTASADGAIQTVLDYWAAVQDRDYARAYRCWADDGAASGQTYEQFAEGFADTAGLTLLLGAPGTQGDASGPVTVPVTLTAVANVPNEPDQPVQHFAGTYTLQTTGAGWRISGADISDVPDPTLPPPQVSDAATLLQSYFDAINRGEYARAYAYWSNLGQASQQTYAGFRQGFEATMRVAYWLGRPRGGVAAGSLYNEVPVVMVAEQSAGTAQAFCGTYTLRRYNVPPFDQFGWRIERADITATGGVELDSAEAERLLDEGCGPAAVSTYTDPQIGYAFDYPAGWYVEATPGWVVVLTSFDPESAPGLGGLSQGQSKIDLMPAKPAENRTLDEMVAEAKVGTAQVLREEPWELAGGVPAVRLQIVGEVAGEMALLLTVINGHSLRLVGYGDLTPFHAVARSLRADP